LRELEARRLCANSVVPERDLPLDGFCVEWSGLPSEQLKAANPNRRDPSGRTRLALPIGQ